MTVTQAISTGKSPALRVVSNRTGATINLRRFTLDEYQRLIEIGIFKEDEQIELLDGLLLEMETITQLHASCVDDLLELLHTVVGKRATLRVRSSVTLEGRASQPRPDITIAIRQPGVYRERHMNEHEILLLIEVADTSLKFDQAAKLDIYVSVGIKEYWIVNLLDNQVEVYQEPFLSATGEGVYKTKRTYASNDIVAIQALPECQVALNDILPRGS